LAGEVKFSAQVKLATMASFNKTGVKQ